MAFKMQRHDIPQDRIANRLGIARETIRSHLAEMLNITFPPNSDLNAGFKNKTVRNESDILHCLFKAPVER